MRGLTRCPISGVFANRANVSCAAVTNAVLERESLAAYSIGQPQTDPLIFLLAYVPCFILHNVLSRREPCHGSGSEPEGC